MKINAPGLNLEMTLSHIAIRDSRPVVVCRLGPYESTAALSGADLRTFVKQALRPRNFWALLRLAVSG